MNKIEFIEKYCRIKDKINNKVLNIHLTKAQKEFIKHLETKKI